MTSKRLSPEEVHAVGRAAVTNALELMADAEILLKTGRPHGAYAFGVSAAEEAAKFNSCRDVLHEWSEPITVTDLNDVLRPPQGRAHLQRYAAFLGYLKGLAIVSGGPVPPELMDVEAAAKEDLRARERILYVEVAPSGVPMTRGGVSKDEATQWVTGMTALFLMHADAWFESLDDALAEARARLGS